MPRQVCGVAFGINKASEVVGQAETAGVEFHGFLYRDGVMIDLGGGVP